MGSDLPKALVEVNGEPLFLHALRPFLQYEDCVEAVIAAPAPFLARFERSLLNIGVSNRVKLVVGGQTRQESVGCALQALSRSCDVVLVHDAARPLVSRELIRRVLSAMPECVAAVPGLAICDTIKRVHGNPPMVERTIERDQLYTVQTPQALRRTVADDAYRRLAIAPFAGTDDVSLVEHFRLGDVRLVAGDPRNIKVTTVDDLHRVQELLAPQP